MPFFYPGRWDLWWKFTGAGLVFTLLMWEVGRWMLLEVRRRWPSLSQTTTRVLVSLLGFTVIVLTVHVLLLWSLEQWIHDAPFEMFTLSGIRNNFLTSLAFWLILGSVYEATYFFHNYRSEVLRHEHLKKEQARRQLEALRSRVNPHFLFNSLTTLSALIGEDPRRAEQFVDELSKVYRYFLKINRLQNVPLGDERAFARSYTFLLATRFEGAFGVKWNVGAQFNERLLPPAALRNTLDYWIKTQIVDASHPLTVHVSADDTGLLLQSPFQPKTVLLNTALQDWQELTDSYDNARQPEQWTLDGALWVRLPFLTPSDLPSQ